MRKTLQISPYGTFEKIEEDGSRVPQVCDAAAFAAVVAEWERRGRPQVLLDFEHKRGEAAGWFHRLWADPKDGLMGEVEYTPPGETADKNKTYRFLSADWMVGSDGRPFQLKTVGFTNTPALPVRPVSNSAGGGSAEPTSKPKQKPKMEKLKTLLGLAADADDAAVEAAVQALVDKNKAAEDAAAENSAKAAAAANAGRIQNSEAFVAAYKQSPAAAQALLDTLKPQAAPPQAAPPQAAQRVVNSAAAGAPAAAKAPGKMTKADARAAMASQPVGKREEFYNAHKDEIDGE